MLNSDGDIRAKIISSTMYDDDALQEHFKGKLFQISSINSYGCSINHIFFQQVMGTKLVPASPVLMTPLQTCNSYS